MSDPIWYKNLDILFTKENLMNFWPTSHQSFEERMNSLTRFILYCGVIISSYNRDTSPLFASILCIIILAFVSKKGKKVFKRLLSGKSCQEPTNSNPVGNRLPYDDVMRSQACNSADMKDQVSSSLFREFPTQNLNSYNKNMIERQFFSTPNTGLVNDQKEFASWLYGAPNKKMCKSNPEVCTGSDVNYYMD